MDLNQVLSKDLFFLKRAYRHPEQFGGKARIQKIYQKSHQSYLKRLQAKPVVTFDDVLPVVEKYQEIKKAIQNNQIVIICGETGSGKTTQIPKICLELNRGLAGMIGHTQPRRIAARAVANRIAEEISCELGDKVGYKVRFQDKTSPNTYVKIMTDGMLLSEIQSDRYLYAYDTIIIDEAHERSLNIDFLLGYLKKTASKRKDLKIIITSATIDAITFSQHFQNAPIINVSGRTYPVEVRYRPLQTLDENEFDISMPEAILDAINELWQKERGDILVFLPGEREIREASDFLHKNNQYDVEILPLFSRLSTAEQQKIFKPKAFGKRVILATNVAETSLTVPGIKYVIDSGQARVKRYAPKIKVEQLNIEKISQAAAKQRMGRCGRTSDGVCIRLYSEEDYLTRSEFTDPEILRSNLAHVILIMFSLNLGNIYSFPFIDMPDSRLINNGIQVLTELGAMTEKEELTSLGKAMAGIPLDPQFSRILLAAKEHNCVYEILIIISALSIQDPKEQPFETKEAARQAHKKFSDSNSDFLSFIYLWDFFERYRQQKYSNKQLLKLSKDNFLSYLRMREWRDFYRQLKEIAEELGFRVNPRRKIIVNQEIKKQKIPYDLINYEQIHRALLSGLISNIGIRSVNEGRHYINVRNSHFYISPASYLFKKKPKWIVASELMETSKVYARNVAVVEPEWIEKEAKHLIKYHYTEPRWSAKRGEVIANRKASLYALTIIPKKVVSFSSIDRSLAREIFIKEGLINDDLNLQATFYQKNKQVIKEIQELEHKSRKQDFILDNVLFEHYNQKLPLEIVNLAELVKWLKQDYKKHNALLEFTIDELIDKSKQLDTEILFPEYLKLENTRLKLTYRFELEHPMDGITLQVPLALLNKIDPICLEWLVPGMIREKLQLLIKALPKHIRRLCVPVPEFVTEFLSSSPDLKQTIISQLVNAIGKKSGDINILTEEILRDWQSHALPDYCYMNIQVFDDDNNELTMGRDLTHLKKQLGEEAQSAFRDYHDNDDFEKHHITHWNIGDIPSEIKFARGRQQLVAYLGLHPNEENDAISLKIFDTQEAADQSHREGVIALIKLQLKEQVKDLNRKGIADFNQIALLLHGLYTSNELKQDILQVICQQAFIEDDALPRNKESFEAQVTVAKNRLPKTKIQFNQYLLNTVLAFSELNKKLGNHVLRNTIENQLQKLIYPRFIQNTPWLIWERLPVYLKAMQLRLDKYGNNPTRDDDNEQEVARLEQELYNLQTVYLKQEKSMPQNIVAYRWKLEELRVSLFAQELKTPFPISVKRLEKEWQKLMKIN